jgi:plasmid stabilization system protein ParE
MKVHFTAPARADLESLGTYISLHYPAIAPRVEARIRAIIAHIEQWPESAPVVSQRPGVRMMPVGRYPYKIYYRVEGDRLEILRIRHTAQRPIVG